MFQLHRISSKAQQVHFILKIYECLKKRNYLENFKTKMVPVQFLTENNSHCHILTEGKDAAFMSDLAY